MKNLILGTILILGFIIPFMLVDGKRYRIILLSILLLLPFYQGFIYFRYMVLLFIIQLLRQGDDNEIVLYTKEPVNKSMIVFFVVSLLSGFVSADILRAIVPIADLIFFYLFFLLCSVGIKRQLTSSLIPRILLWCLLISVFVQTMQLLGLQEFYIYDEASLNMNTGMGYDNSDRVVRYWGTFGNALTFSSYLAVLGLFLFGYYHNSPQKGQRRLSYIILTLSIYGVILTAGRTAMISMVIGILFYTFTRNWKKAFVVMGAILLIMILFSTVVEQYMSGATLGIYQRFTSLGDDKSYRTETWIRALPVLLDSPIFGTGPGNLQTQIAPMISSIYINDKNGLDLPWGHVENTYLSVLYTFGIAGFSCFMYMLVKSFRYCYRLIKRHSSPMMRQLAYALSTAWVVMGINMIANPVFVTDYRLISLMLFLVAYSVQVGWVPSRSASRIKVESLQQTADLKHTAQLI